MRLDHLQYHMNRRALLGAAAKVGAAAAVTGGLGGTLLAGTAGATPTGKGPRRGTADVSPDSFDDSFDHTKALDGTWAKESAERYGSDDQIGTLNEVTPQKTASALKLLADASAVATYRLGHLMRNGFPAFVNYPPRRYQQRLQVIGLTPDREDEFFSTTATGFEGEDEWRAADRERGPLGYLTTKEPLGANVLSYLEERFPESYTYQIATQFDNLNHIGVENTFYNGFKANEFVRATGTTELGMDRVSPFVTRGVLIDVLGWKLATGGSGVQEVNGHEVLADTYRITVEDILATMEWEQVGAIEPGDVVVIRTGWWQLAEDPSTHEQYLKSEPGIYIREAKFLAAHRPALVAADSFALEVLGHPDVTWAFPVHQTLLTQWGIRIGEGVISDDLSKAQAYEFVYSYSPQWAEGSTAGNAPPMALVPAAD